MNPIYVTLQYSFSCMQTHFYGNPTFLLSFREAWHHRIPHSKYLRNINGIIELPHLPLMD